jgi:predicted acetyltransferase
MAKLRHYLNEHLRERGGHAAYAVRKSERGKGYGKLILKKLINKAAKKDINELLLTVDDVNTASRKVIEANGGQLENIKNGECYYWIKNI